VHRAERAPIRQTLNEIVSLASSGRRGVTAVNGPAGATHPEPWLIAQ
jgi:hypothetical protein